MATQYAFGKIVTDGLVLCLDAADRNSYVSGSTTWFNMAGSNNGTLTNGPTFNTGSGGNIVFDGVDDYVSTSTARNTTTNEDYTVNIVFKITSFTSTDMRLFGATSGDTLQLASGWDTNTFRLWLGGTWNNTSFVSSTNTVSYLTITHSGTDTLVYVNGTYSSIIPSRTSYFSNLGFGNPYILTYGTYFNGNIYSTQVYNRALTASEVLQNYNAQKSRFGL